MTNLRMEFTDVPSWDYEEQATLKALGWSHVGEQDGRLIFGRPKEDHP